MVAKKYSLQRAPVGSDATPFEFEWDPETGIVSGPEAVHILEGVKAWDGNRIGGPPEPGVSYKTGNPLYDPKGMAVVLANLGVTPPRDMPMPRYWGRYDPNVVY